MAQKNSVSSFNETEQLVISYELLFILRWMIEHEVDGLKNLILQAITSSEKEKQTTENTNASFSDDMKHTIVDLFDLLEALLSEAINEQAVNKIVERNLMPAIDHIDASLCDEKIVRQSIEKTTQMLDKGSHEQAQSLLFKELLKQWKPNKKSMLN